MTVDLVKVESVFDMQRRTRKPVVRPRTIRELHEAHCPGEPRHYIIDGRAASMEDELADATEVVAIFIPRGPITPLIVSAIISTVIGVGISMLIDLLFGTPGEPEQDSSSPTYGWSGIRNSRTQGNPIAIIYGEHRVGGQFISMYRRALGTSTERLFVVMAIGAGPLTSIAGLSTHEDNLSSDTGDLPDLIRFDGHSITQYDSVELWIRQGRLNQTKLGTHLKKICHPWPVDQLLSDEWFEYQTHIKLTGVHFNLRWPRGQYENSGGIQPHPQTIEMQYRTNSFGSWINLPDTLITNPTTHGFNFTIDAEDVFANQILGAQFRIRLQQAASDDPSIGDEVRVTGVNEVTGELADEYGQVALLGFQVDATDQLNGRVPLITTMVQGVSVPVYDPASGFDEPAVTYQYSTNPAWIALDVLLNRNGGMGNWITLDHIDMESWYRWAQWCDESLAYQEEVQYPEFTTTETEETSIGDASVVLTGDDTEFAQGDYVRVENEGANQILTKTDLGGGRYELALVKSVQYAYPEGFELHRVSLEPIATLKRHQCHIVFDQPTNAWEALKTVMRTGRAVPVKMGNKIKARYEGASEPVQHIADTNMIKKSFQVTYLGRSERWDKVNIQILDAAEDYDQKPQVAIWPFPDLDRVPVEKTIPGFGITDARQARREAHYQLKANNLVRKKCRFQMPLDGIAMEPGDVISIGSTMPAYSHAVSRANGTIASFELDQDVTLAASTTYLALIRTPTSPEAVEVTITSVAGTYAAGDTITTDGSSLSIEDAAITIGPASQIKETWRVMKVELAENLTASLQCVQYVPEVYETVGWTLGDVSEPPAVGCISPGDYFLSAAGLAASCPCGLSCGAGRVCVMRQFDIDVTVSGAAADCVEITNIDGAGVTFRVIAGCSGEFCIDMDASISWACCPDSCQDPDLCFCATAGPICTANEQNCFTVCP